MDDTLSEDELALAILTTPNPALKVWFDGPGARVGFVILASDRKWVYFDKDYYFDPNAEHFDDPKELIRNFFLIERGARLA